MVEAIFTVIGNVITAFAGVIGSGFTSLIALFYDATNGITLLGTLMLIGVGVSLVYWAFRLVRRLVRLR